MAKISFDLKQLKAFNKKLENAAKETRNAIADDCLNVMAAEYLRVAKMNTPVGGGKEIKVSEGNYKAISAYEVGTAKGYSRAKKRSSGRTKLLKRITNKRGGGKEFKVLTASEHMRRSWQAGKVATRGNEHSIPVLNSASYASFVNDGHRQTPGRYVPILGKRLVKSWVEGLFIAEKAEKSVVRKGNRIISVISREHLEKGLK